ncbi:MAG TPA: ABC transporter ATP-binding protein, partial [Tepidiformaceae bacterium]|nr:ABC transporter ATP-binding protein [Tepidiformaceae bacterium]
MASGLEVQDVRWAAGSKEILRGVSLAVPPGETVALLGPSGCGKTTLLRVIAGLEQPNTGMVLIDGKDVTRLPPHRRGFGLMFQEHALFPHMNVRRNIEFGLRQMAVPARRRGERVEELLASVGLVGFGERTLEGLSGGERQRVALARTLAPSPRLLMLDEPLGSLDRGLRERLVIEVRDILDHLDIPALYVTHDQFEAFAIADRLAIMRGGRIVRDGTPADVFAEPRTEFVARFLGMENLVRGHRNSGG